MSRSGSMRMAARSRSEIRRWALFPRPASTNWRTRMLNPSRSASKTRAAVRPDEQVRDLGRSRELSVLAVQVRFRHPTGAGAAGSNVDSHSVSDCLGEDLLERWPAKWHQVVRDHTAHQVHGLVCKNDLRFMACLYCTV